MSARPRRKSLEEADEHPDERWMASYMDMVTVLMCMFIVLFAMSTVDQNKFEQLANSLATGFGSVESTEVDTAQGVVVRPDLVDLEAAGFTATDTTTDIELARAEVDNLSSLREQMRVALTQNGVENLVEFKIDERGLTVGLIGSETFFQPDSAVLSVQAVTVLDSVAPSLVPDTRNISIEGHADRHGRTVNFPTDWELSSGRATQVLRRLVEHGAVPQVRVGAVGYGAARPAATGDSLEDMAQNRRVDVVVLSALPEAVRTLIPHVLAHPVESGAAPSTPPAKPGTAGTAPAKGHGPAKDDGHGPAKGDGHGPAKGDGHGPAKGDGHGPAKDAGHGPAKDAGHGKDDGHGKQLKPAKDDGHGKEPKPAKDDGHGSGH
jgi:chemotaxis protein MotB